MLEQVRKEFFCTDSSRSESLNIGEHQRISLQPGPNITFVVPSFQDKYSGFTFQLHTQQAVISLYNGSVDCLSLSECTTSGSSVGMVQLFTTAVSSYEFKANVRCLGGDPQSNVSNCQSNVTVLVAVVGIETNRMSEWIFIYHSLFRSFFV